MKTLRSFMGAKEGLRSFMETKKGESNNEIECMDKTKISMLKLFGSEYKDKELTEN